MQGGTTLRIQCVESHPLSRTYLPSFSARGKEFRELNRGSARTGRKTPLVIH
jgi:hypothetical protein